MSTTALLDHPAAELLADLGQQLRVDSIRASAYPCDANQAARLTAAMADCEGVSYLRTIRGGTPVITQEVP